MIAMAKVKVFFLNTTNKNAGSKGDVKLGESLTKQQIMASKLLHIRKQSRCSAVEEARQLT